MSLTLGAVIGAARNRSPFFHKSRGTPDKLLGDRLSEYQNELIGKAVLRDNSFLSQTATLVLNTGTGDLAATAGAGSATGLPGSVDTAGAVQPVLAPAGALVQVGVTAEDGATLNVAKRVATSASATSITSTGAGRATNEDQTRVLVILEGTGAGQYRQILSNTADTWVISTGSDGRQWAIVPDATSVLSVVTPKYSADGAALVADAVPALVDRPAYLVRLSSLGVPFIDFVAPLVGRVDTGVPLPAAGEVTGGTVYYQGDPAPSDPLTITTYGQRYNPPGWPAVYTHGGRVFLCGDADDWADVASLGLEYTPVTPNFTAVSEYFLLPDTARTVLVEQAALALYERTAGQPGTPFKMADVERAEMKAERAEQAFLGRIGLTRRARITVMQPGW